MEYAGRAGSIYKGICQIYFRQRRLGRRPADSQGRSALTRLAAKKMLCADRQVPDLVRPTWGGIEGPVAIDSHLD